MNSATPRAPPSDAMADAARWFAENGYVNPKRLRLMQLDSGTQEALLSKRT